MKKRGFTLIELLIVIAIIAILALIAIPNFIEAQTRSKVTRVMADMRAIGTAVEAYAIDWSRYPMYCNGLDMTDGVIPPRTLATLTYVPSNLTTPVAYLTDTMIDPLRTAAVKANDPRRPFIYRHAIDQGTTYYVDYLTSMRNSASDEVAAFYIAARSYFRLNTDDVPNYQWLLDCPGPDLISNMMTSKTPKPIAYDPTNGTISDGDIMRWGP